MKKLIQSILLILLLSSGGFTLAQNSKIGSSEDHVQYSSGLDRLSQFVETEIKEGLLPGAVIMVSRKNKILHKSAHGYSSLSSKVPMQKDHIFYIQSMTKPIITVAFMMLYEEGRFELSDPVEKYLPQFKNRQVSIELDKGGEGKTEAAKTPITIAHLLSHTAGLSHGLGQTQLDREYGLALYFQPHKTIKDRVNAMANLPLYGQPGEQWYYSAAPDLIALLIEKFSGQSVPEFLQERIFDPLKMEDTGYNLSKKQQARMAKYHILNGEGKLIKGPRQTPVEGNTVFGGTHGLFSTASDYMKFCQMLLNEGQLEGKRILQPETVEMMTQNQVGDLFERPGQGFGYGFAVVTDKSAYEGYGSEGLFYWSGIYNTFFFVDPREELIGIMMAQSAPYSGEWGEKLRKYIYSDLKK